jgi:hypothetical protein
MLPSDQIARKECPSIFEANRSAEFDILERELPQTNENTSQPYKLRRRGPAPESYRKYLPRMCMGFSQQHRVGRRRATPREC